MFRPFVHKAKAAFLALALVWALAVSIIPAAPQFSYVTVKIPNESRLRADAEEGWPWQQAVLGSYCVEGRPPCSPRNYIEAEKWLRSAANQGLSIAMYDLGHLYLRGNGVSQSYAESYYWFQLAHSKINPVSAISDLEGMEEAQKNLTVEQIATIEKRIEEWKAAESPALTKTRFKRRVIYLEIKMGIILIPLVSLAIAWTVIRPAKVNKYFKLITYICMALSSIIACFLLWFMAMQFY